MRRVVALAVLLCLLVSTWAEAQLAVADAPVLAAVVSVGATILNMLAEIRRQAQALADWGAIVAEIQAMAQLVADVEALITDIRTLDDGWDQLTDSGALLCAIDDLVSWKGQALQWQTRALSLVRVANRLIGRTINVLLSLQRVLGGILGAVAGSQSINALAALIAANLQQMQSMMGAFNAAALSQDIIDAMLGLQFICLHETHMQGWGGYSR